MILVLVVDYKIDYESTHTHTRAASTPVTELDLFYLADLAASRDAVFQIVVYFYTISPASRKPHVARPAPRACPNARKEK